MPQNRKKLVSIVIPSFNEEQSLPVLTEELNKTIASAPEYDFEVVFVDDASTDRTWEVINGLHKQHPHINGIRLMKNSGSHIACHAGLEAARGDFFAVIAADLQDPPEIIPEMLKLMKGGVSIVWGARRRRAESIQVKLFSRIYYLLMKRFVFSNIHEKGADVFLIDRDARDVICRLDEKDSTIFGLLLWSGFPQVYYEYDKMKRSHGESKWTLSKKLKLFVDSFVSFSYMPIRLISAMGLVFSLFFIGLVVFTLWDWYQSQHAPQGYTSLMIIILAIGTVQSLILAVLGEYLWRAFEHIKHRPLYIIRDTRRHPDN